MSVRSRISKMITPNFTKFSAHVTFSDDNATSYVLPVLWMTSCLPIIREAKATLTGHILKLTSGGEVWCLPLSCFMCIALKFNVPTMHPSQTNPTWHQWYFTSERNSISVIIHAVLDRLISISFQFQTSIISYCYLNFNLSLQLFLVNFTAYF